MSLMEEQQEWDELLASIPLDTPTTEAANMIAGKVADAIQAQREWAHERRTEALHAGFARQWRAHVQRQRPKTATKQGVVKGVGGVKRRNGNVTAFVQVPLDQMTREELTDYHAMYASNLSTLSANAKAVKRLLDVMDRCPTAKTPAEACQLLDLDLDKVLAGAA